MAINFDIRQSETRILQDQLNSTAVTEMDSTLASINKELTPPGRLIAQATPSLVVTVGSGTIANPNTAKNKTLPQINGQPVTFAGGTITFPSASGTITVSPGTNATITIGASQFVAVLVQLTSAGQINLKVGVTASSSAAAIVPTQDATKLSLGYILVQSNASSVIQSITNSMLYQYSSSNGTLGFLQTAVTTDSSTTGSAVTLPASDIVTGITRVTNASLVSISGITAGLTGQLLILENQKGSSITINNLDAGASALNRISTGTGGAVSLASGAAFQLMYDSVVGNWLIVGGTGSGSSVPVLTNYIINGAFDIWQRGTSIMLNNGTTAYQADRWYAKNSLGTGGQITYSQVTGSVNQSKYGAQLQITAAPTAAQANGCELYYVLENQDSLEFYNQTATFQAKIKALGNVNAIGVSFMYATTETKPTTVIGTEQTFTVNSAGFVTVTASQAIGTAMTTSGSIAIRIRIFSVSTGNTYDLNNGFVTEQTMLNLGSVASSSFVRSSTNLGAELAKCQRYYFVIFGSTPIVLRFSGTTSNPGGTLNCTLRNVVTFRQAASPIFSSSGSFNVVGGTTNTSGSSPTFLQLSGNEAFFMLTSAGASAIYSVYGVGLAGTSSYISVDCDI